MSKKSRRQRRLNLPPEAYNTPAAAPVARPVGNAVPATPTPAQRRVSEVNWQAEYGDVLGDLKRTGILAALIMAVMVGLSFIIR